MSKKCKCILGVVVVFMFLLPVVGFYCFQPTKLIGTSMEPTFYEKDGGFMCRFLSAKKMKRFDIVAISGDVYNKRKDNGAIKRIIGLPGEIVDYIDKKLYINGTLVDDCYAFYETEENYVMEDLIFGTEYTLYGPYHWELGEGEYIVLGDNRVHSLDSRAGSIGIIHEDMIQGTFIKSELLSKLFHLF